VSPITTVIVDFGPAVLCCLRIRK